MGRSKRVKNEQAITLIALVITIIVLLILAGVSIAMLTGDNGILTQAETAKIETRGGAVEEQRDLWKAELNIDNQLNNKESKSLETLLDELIADELIMPEERIEIEQTGKVTIGSRTIEFFTDCLLTDVVKEGDFINYTAGVWTQEEIDNLGNLYKGKELPTSAGKFGGFQVGDSKDYSIDIQKHEACLQNKYEYGWRVLDIDSNTNTVKLIHSGTPEAYYQGYNATAGFFSYYIMTGENDEGHTYSGKYRDWREYENLDYAVERSAHAATYSEMEELKYNSKIHDLLYPGEGYWLAKVAGTGWSLDCKINSSTNYLIGNVALGIRPVITLKQGIRIEKPTTEHDGSSPEKAYILKK